MINPQSAKLQKNSQSPRKIALDFNLGGYIQDS